MHNIAHRRRVEKKCECMFEIVRGYMWLHAHLFMSKREEYVWKAVGRMRTYTSVHTYIYKRIHAHTEKGQGNVWWSVGRSREPGLRRA